MYLKDFVNVGRVCLDCKSNIISTANNEQKSWGFSRLVRKTKKKKWEICEWRRNGLVFRQKPIDKQGESEIRTWILGWWVSNSAAIEARLVAGSWSADSGDEIQGTWSLAVDLLWCRWRWGLCVGLVFYSQGREGIKKEREEQREYMDVLSPN